MSRGHPPAEVSQRVAHRVRARTAQSGEDRGTDQARAADRQIGPEHQHIRAAGDERRIPALRRHSRLCGRKGGAPQARQAVPGPASCALVGWTVLCARYWLAPRSAGRSQDRSEAACLRAREGRSRTEQDGEGECPADSSGKPDTEEGLPQAGIAESPDGGGVLGQMSDRFRAERWVRSPSAWPGVSHDCPVGSFSTARVLSEVLVAGAAASTVIPAKPGAAGASRNP